MILCAGVADGVQVRLEDRGSEEYLMLAEVEVYSSSCPPSAPPSPPAPPPVDVATLCPVGVNGSAQTGVYGGRVSTYCHDGGTSSYCMSGGEMAPYLQLYFAPVEISHVRVYNHVFGSGWGIGAHSIAYRDASTGSWVRCASCSHREAAACHTHDCCHPPLKRGVERRQL